MRTNVPRAVRALRMRRGWRQEDLGRRAGISRDVVSRIELGQLDGVTIRSLRRVLEALDANLSVEAWWRGADLDRLIDRAHAGLQNAAAERLRRFEWDVFAEVGFNHFGERGSCDLVAWHSATQTLLVVEVKSRIGNVQELLRLLDVKARLGRQVAEQLGLRAPRRIVRVLVLPESHGARNVIARHAALFAGFDVRGRSAFRWLASPRAAKGLIWYEGPTNSDHSRTMPVERVRQRPPAGSAPH